MSLALTAGEVFAGMEVAREGQERLAHRQLVAGRVVVARQADWLSMIGPLR